ncbi:MAG: N-acetyltransferase [Proteobacteria bacterium]|nr:N-acetyltransferase [Pseudomonadota bacterium]MBU1594791.1 N-acetyltransferase [Pseudomonadota bacterium]
MLMRPETPADHAAIREINIAAFAVHPFSRQTEHLIVEALRAAGALAISLVAEAEGRVTGHIAFSQAPVDGQDLGWYLLGPVAVLPEAQGRGIGSELVLAGIAELRKRNASGCVLVGDPAFYTRLGFRQAQGLRYPGVPPEVVLCLPLSGPEPDGVVAHHPSFDVEP